MNILIFFLLALAYTFSIRREMYEPNDDRINDYSEDELKLIEQLFKNLGEQNGISALEKEDHDSAEPMFGDYSSSG